MPRWSLACASLPLALAGCLGFGGPLVGEDQGGDDDTATADTSATDTSATETGVEEHPCGPLTGVVDYVVDGDTVELATGERVRYILVDTTELTDNECWSGEGKAFNSTLTLGQTVSLEYDQECTDKYGRLLAYVSVGDVEVNRALLENGHACLLYIPPNGNSKVADYQTLETQARNDGLGMWGACPEPIPCE